MSEELLRQQAIAGTIGVTGARRHIFLCCDQTYPEVLRPRAVPGGVGLPQTPAEGAWPLRRRRHPAHEGQLPPDLRGRAHRGGVPEGTWYRACDPPVLERIIQEHLVGGHVVEEHLIVARPLEIG
jgi:hypothetical protein